MCNSGDLLTQVQEILAQVQKWAQESSADWNCARTDTLYATKNDRLVLWDIITQYFWESPCQCLIGRLRPVIKPSLLEEQCSF